MDGGGLMPNTDEYNSWRAAKNAERAAVAAKHRDKARMNAETILADARSKRADATDPDEVAKLDAVIAQQTAILNELT